MQGFLNHIVGTTWFSKLWSLDAQYLFLRDIANAIIELGVILHSIQLLLVQLAWSQDIFRQQYISGRYK